MRMSDAGERLANRLKVIREEMGLTQQQMAGKLGVSRMAYRYYETGQRTPDITFLDSLCELTAYPMEYLLGKTENKTHDTLGYDKTIMLNDETVTVLRNTPYYGHLLNYIVCHPRFAEFADYAANAVAYDYLAMFRERDNQNTTLLEGDDSGLHKEKRYELYRALAMAMLNTILEVDPAMCPHPGKEGPSRYELRAAMVMDCYARHKEKEAQANAEKTRK